MNLQLQKISHDIPDFSNQEYHDLNHTMEVNQTSSLAEITDEFSLVEILKLIEHPDDYLNSELPLILENLINSRELDESNMNIILIADLSRVLIQYIKWVKCFPNVKPYYKVSSNNVSELLKILKKLSINFICYEESGIEDVFNLENNSNILNTHNNRHFNNNNNNINNLQLPMNQSKNLGCKDFIIDKNPVKTTCNLKNENDSLFNYNTNTNINNKILTTSGYLNTSASTKISNNSTSFPKIILSKKPKYLIHNNNDFEAKFSDYNEFNDEFIKNAAEKGLKCFICCNTREIMMIKGMIPDVKIMLRIEVNGDSEITRNEKKRITQLFEASEECDFIENISGLSLNLNPNLKTCEINHQPMYNTTNNMSNQNNYINESLNFFNQKKIYELFKKVRELFDEAEEYGIQIKTLDIGSPDNEGFYTEENLKIFSDSLNYFFSDLQIEIIAQLGKFFSASAFTLLTRNTKRNNLNLDNITSENLNNLIDENIVNVNNEVNILKEPLPLALATSQISGNSTNMTTLNSIEISGNNIINVSTINQNMNYYLDLDLLPIEENFTNTNENFEFNKNFIEDFILNDSAFAIDSQQINFNTSITNNNNINCLNISTIKENIIPFNLVMDNENINLNNFISNADCNSKNLIELFDYKETKTSLEPYLNPTNNIQEKNSSPRKIEIDHKNIIYNNKYNKPHKKNIAHHQEKGRSFEEMQIQENEKLECKLKTCIYSKIFEINNLNSQNILQDWFIYENAGDLNICKSCEDNCYPIPEVYYIKNRISLKLEKYFYVIMNEFYS